jgi:hypothetical protein
MSERETVTGLPWGGGVRAMTQLSNWGLTTNTTESGLRAYMDDGPCFRPGQVSER